MSHHFVDLLEELKERLSRMMAMVQQSVEWSVQGVLTLDTLAARQAIDQDRLIDEEEVKIEKGAIDLLALHQPAASDLRLITTIIKANSDFERIADCAVNVCQRVIPLASMGRFEAPEDLRVMANSVIATLRDTIKAFKTRDDELARRV